MVVQPVCCRMWRGAWKAALILVVMMLLLAANEIYDF